MCLTDPVNKVTMSQESLRKLLEKHFKITANIFFLYLKTLNLFDAYIQVISCAINAVIHCSLAFLFSLKNTLKDKGGFLLFSNEDITHT